MDDRDPITQRIRVVQLLAAALIFGVVVFAAIASVAPVQSPQPAQTADALRIAGFALMAVLCPAAMLARALMLRPATTQGDSNPYASGLDDEQASLEHLERCVGRFFVATIFCFALLEGVALFAIVLRLLTGNPADLLIALAPLVLMLACFPTMGRWRQFAGLGRGH